MYNIVIEFYWMLKVIHAPVRGSFNSVYVHVYYLDSCYITGADRAVNIKFH